MSTKLGSLMLKSQSKNGAKPHASPKRAPDLKMRVAFQGDHGAYADSAITQIWRHPVDHIPFPTFCSAVRAVHNGEADACVIPVENSIIGRVDAGWQALALHPDLRTVTETLVPVQHCLLAPKGATIVGLTSAASHPAALAQCEAFFDAHPWIKASKSFDTGGAAREVAEAGDVTRAAIASKAAAHRYGLTVLDEGLQGQRDNYTRFVALVSERSGLWRRNHAIRGATSVEVDDAEQVAEATCELLHEIVARNSLEIGEIVSVVFTATQDLRSVFPALAAREMGWVGVPLLCASEIAVEGAMPHCLRVLIQVELRAPRKLDTHVYLRNAVSLRPDLHRSGSVWP
jgi:monofunctional chorismate mutase